MVIEFEGGQFTVRLSRRGEEDVPPDNHVLVNILSEDDGNWEVVQSFSSYWLAELIASLTSAAKYMADNCEPDMHQDIQFGYRFKE